MQPPVLVTDVVWKEGGARKQGDANGEAAERTSLMTAWAGAATDAAPPESKEAETAEALLLQGDLDDGEISILAWAVHHPEVVPVFHDHQALFRAVEELPLRPVLSFHGFLGQLRNQFGLDRAVAERISQRYCKNLTWKHQRRPVAPEWWAR